MSAGKPPQSQPLFSPGDIVVLKSGGPKMTVEEYAHDECPSVCCVWFAIDIRQSGKFVEAGLIKWEELKEVK